MPKIQKNKPAVKKAKSPKNSASKITKKGNKGSVRNYFTIGEDCIIIEALSSSKNKTPKSAIAKEVAEKIKRTVESVRDRIKRYHSKISKSDTFCSSLNAKPSLNSMIMSHDSV